MERTLVVTGTSTGIGRAIATRAGREGWRVLATVRDPDAPRTRGAAAALAEAGCAVTRLELRDSASVADCAAEIEAWCGGRLDALVNNAGIALPGAIEDLGMEEVRDLFEVNAFGHVALTQRLLPFVRAARGRVVFMSSDRTRSPRPMYGAYAASKRALEGFAAALAVETAPSGVRVCVLELGSFRSAIRDPIRPRLERIGAGSPYAEAAEAARRSLGAPPLGEPDQVAAATLGVLVMADPPATTVVRPSQ